MQLSAGAVTLVVGMLLLLGLLVVYASGVGRRSHAEPEAVPTGNPSMERKVVVILGLLILSGVLLTGYSFVEPQRQATDMDIRETVSIKRGIETFTTLCIGCHGVDGQGAVVPGSDPQVVAPQLNRADMRPTDPDEYKARYTYVVNTITRGKGDIMPHWGRSEGGPLLDEQITELALLITKGDKVIEGNQTAWEVAKETSAEKIAHGAPEPQAPSLDVAGLTPDEIAGQKLFTGKAGCIGCHTIGSTGGVTGPNLTNIASVAAARKPGMDAKAYIEESIHTPSAYVVPGYPDGVMPQNFAQILSADEINQIVDFLLTRK
jgi:mono/diheme cytochrome c family protein